MNPNAIEQNTREAFTSSTALPSVLPGYVPSADQTEYAGCVGDAIGAPDPGHSEGGEITLLEAGTGIGKSLGYLVPLLLNSVLSGEKCLISTYTLALQKQLLEIDGPVACEVVSRLTGKPPPTIARRVGRRNFVDYDRVADLLAETEREGQNAISSVLRAWLHAAPTTFDEAGQDFGLVLPDDITQDDVCITAGSSLDASRS